MTPPAAPTPPAPSPRTAVVVLAGGTSRRFGTDKLDALVGGVSLLDAALATLPTSVDLLLVGPPRATTRTATWVREDPPGGGPAAGIVAGMRAALARGADVVAVLPADAPGSGPAARVLLRELAEHPRDGAVVGLGADGREQPLQLALSRPAAEQLAGTPGGGQGASARALVASLVPSARRVPLPPAALYDVDTPAQLAVWRLHTAEPVERVLGAVHRVRAERAPAVPEVAGGAPRPVVVALDGPRAAGTGTLAAALALRTGAAVVPGEDFDALGPDGAGRDGWARWTDAEVADRALDWRRLRAEALVPLAAGREADYRPQDVGRGGGPAATRRIEPQPLVVLEGGYVGRPELADLVDLVVRVAADPERRRLLDGAPGEDPALRLVRERGERWYLEQVRPPGSCDLLLDIGVGVERDAAPS